MRGRAGSRLASPPARDRSREQGSLRKLRRTALRATLDLAGAGAARAIFSLTPAEEAALALRKARATPATPLPPWHFVFAIPLVGRVRTADWPLVERNLARTLGSLAAQSAPEWTCLLAGQDRPALPEPLASDPRIRFLPFEADVAGSDQMAKLSAMARAVPEIGHGRVVFVPFDADDIARRDYLEHVAPHAGTGYLLDGGLMLDAATGRVADAGRRSFAEPGRRPFWKLCGSCAGLPVETAAGGAGIEWLARSVGHRHRMFAHAFAMAGLRPAHLDAALVIYLINHGENVQLRRGQGGFKQRYVASQAIEESSRLAQIARDFPLRGLRMRGAV